MTSKRIVITLCGSSRFSEAHALAQMHLSLMGAVVIPLGCYGHADVPTGAHSLVGTNSPGMVPTPEKAVLDSLHFDKIAMSDAIFVVNVGGYVGESTKREIAFAQKRGVKVMYMFPESLV